MPEQVVVSGDRIFLGIEGNVPLLDTLPVSAGPKVTVPDIGDISLAGVLRSELPEHMKTQLARYVRDARVRSIDTSAALAMPGVKAILTAAGGRVTLLDGSPLETLRALLAESRIDLPEGLPAASAGLLPLGKAKLKTS